jgi:2-methylisocitrate lyase-like PEP mutase family enzyme
MVHLQDQKNKADAFRAMHRGTNVLLLPNAWDVISARIFEEAGFPLPYQTCSDWAWRG